MKDFIEQHGLWSAAQREAADRLRREWRDIGSVRLLWADQHGLTRLKTVTGDEFGQVLERGRPFQLAPVLLDTANIAVVSPLSAAAGFGIPELAGLPDGLLVPDPCTSRLLPWGSDSGLVLCDLHLKSGAAVPFCTRQILRQHLSRLASAGLEFRIGLELEFYVARLVDDKLSWAPADGRGPPPPVVAPLDDGQLYLGESASDRLDAVAEMVRTTAEQLCLPLSTIEVETGAGHLECTFEVLDAASAADAALLFRAATKQVGRRAGYHLSFMPRPQLDGTDPSGWHLHQSLWEGDRNLFADAAGGGLSSDGEHFLAGLLAHAPDTSLLYAPLVNSYKRFEPDSFTPWSACWTTETRGSLVRVLPGGDDPAMTRLEFRGGDSSANPYLYVASQLISGRDGIDRRLSPGSPTVEPSASAAPALPRSLIEAVDAFEASPLLREQLSDLFVDYLSEIKRHELRRFLATVTDWEQREYFRHF